MKNLPSKPKMQKYTLLDFEKQFPNDDVCLKWLKNYLYPDGIFCETCQKITNHYRVASRKSFSCQFCGNHVHPTADTIYHKSSTPLRLWFYAVYLMAFTRCGISAKQLERELRVTYKTAWRMFKQIRSMLAEDDTILSNAIEVDETYVGAPKAGKRGRGAGNKTIVAGAVERQGSVKTKVVPNVKRDTLFNFINDNVEPDTTIYTDELKSYNSLKYQGYDHKQVNHGAKLYVIGDAHTNSIEGFWSLTKGGLRGVYRGRVMPRYLQTYFNEFAFRCNRRFDTTPMFLSFLKQVQKSCD